MSRPRPAPTRSRCLARPTRALGPWPQHWPAIENPWPLRGSGRHGTYGCCRGGRLRAVPARGLRAQGRQPQRLPRQSRCAARESRGGRDARAESPGRPKPSSIRRDCIAADPTDARATRVSCRLPAACVATSQPPGPFPSKMGERRGGRSRPRAYRRCALRAAPDRRRFARQRLGAPPQPSRMPASSTIRCPSAKSSSSELARLPIAKIASQPSSRCRERGSSVRLPRAICTIRLTNSSRPSVPSCTAISRYSLCGFDVSCLRLPSCRP